MPLIARYRLWRGSSSTAFGRTSPRSCVTVGQHERKLVLVVMQMHHACAVDRGERRRRVLVCPSLELDGADGISRPPRVGPKLGPAQQPRRIADDVGEKP